MPRSPTVAVPFERALALLERPDVWAWTAADLYAEAVCWQAPARGLRLDGRAAVLAQLRSEARSFLAGPPVALQRAVAGTRIVDESAWTFICPVGGIAGVAARTGDRLELKRTRLLRFEEGRIVDELNLETWTVLER